VEERHKGPLTQIKFGFVPSFGTNTWVLSLCRQMMTLVFYIYMYLRDIEVTLPYFINKKRDIYYVVFPI
jgi:hypothetical protein